MHTLSKKLKQVNYAKLFKWWLILGICVGLLGGGLSALLLQPQIREAVTAMEQRDSERSAQKGESGNRHHEADKWEELSISEPSSAAKAAVTLTGAAAVLFAGFYWLSFAGWLYKKACSANMNGLLWGCLALAGNLAAAILFFLTRSFLRQKCSACGSWQANGLYCRVCGAKLALCCPACGNVCSFRDRYCHSCGEKLTEQSD